MKEETIRSDDDGRRLDRVLRKAFPNVPPGAIAGAVRRGDVRINGKRAKNDTRVSAGDVMGFPDWSNTGHGRKDPSTVKDPPRLVSDNIVSGQWSIPVVNRGDDWIALNKPAGLSTHGTGALDEMVRAIAAEKGWWSESLSFKPGPVHRLDRNTSGVQLFSLTAEGARTLTEQLRTRSVSKIYIALVTGYLTQRTDCNVRIAYDREKRTAVPEPAEAPGRDRALRRLRFTSAMTRFFPLAYTANGKAGLVAAVPETGRTHQIRCHAASLGIPLIGDEKYGGAPWEVFDDQYDVSRGDPRYILHAAVFATAKPAMMWNAPLASATYGLLRRHFGDLSAIERRLNEVATAACTRCPRGDTIKI